MLHWEILNGTFSNLNCLHWQVKNIKTVPHETFLHPLQLKNDMNWLHVGVKFIWTDGIRQGTIICDQKRDLHEELCMCAALWLAGK